jgi:predicted nucleic acid-binding protein
LNYFDASYLVRLYFEEPGWKEVRGLRCAEPWACAWLGKLEVSGAFHRKFRERQVSRAGLKQLQEQFAEDCRAGEFRWLGLEDRLADEAGEIYRKLPPSCFLRASDAFHLACARRHGFRTVFSHDRNLRAAARFFGLQGRDVIPASR